MDTKIINKGNLKVSQTLVDFLEKEVLELLDLDMAVTIALIPMTGSDVMERSF